MAEEEEEALSLGAVYERAAKEGDSAKAVAVAIALLHKLAEQIPRNHEDHRIVAGITNMLIERMHGKLGHLLLQPAPKEQHIGGVVQNGLTGEFVASIGAAAVIFLEEQGLPTQTAAKHVSAVLQRQPGVTKAGLSAVKRWRDYQSADDSPGEHLLVRGAIPGLVKLAKAEFHLGRSADAKKFVALWLKDKLASKSSLLDL